LEFLPADEIPRVFSELKARLPAEVSDHWLGRNNDVHTHRRVG
jgi:hypothetical protein